MAGRGVALQLAKALEINPLVPEAHFQGDRKSNSVGLGPVRLLLPVVETQLRCLLICFSMEEARRKEIRGWMARLYFFLHLNFYLLS